jgi:FkbM family methyltransferase
MDPIAMMPRWLRRRALAFIESRGFQRVAGPRTVQEELQPFFAAMKGLGFNPRHIVDVGANRGLWTRYAIEFFPRAHYTLVEPQPELRNSIEDLIAAGFSIDWINAGLGDKPGCLEFHICKRDDSSTFVPPKDNSLEDRKTFVQVRTLNDIARCNGMPDLVKIDAEGMDLKVLAGASDLFGKTEIFLVEADITCRAFENTLAAVVWKMDEAGYSALDITTLNRSPKFGVLWLCEVAFLRNGSEILSGLTYE